MVTSPRIALIATCALLLPACSGGEGPRPNVLLITLDTTRADRLGCYDGSAETPNIDALAAEGALFARAVSTAGLTPMSHASILTGLNNYRHGLRVFYSEDASYTLDTRVDTLPEILQRRGWRTGAFVSAYPVSEFYGLDRGFKTFDAGIDLEGLNLTKQQSHSVLWEESGRSRTQRRGDLTVDEAIGWLDRGDDDPWCLWVHLFDVHDYSLVPPAEWIARFDIEYDRSVTNNDVAWRDRMYDAELAFVDEQVGRLLQRVKERGEWDDTLVVITADHGQGLIDGLKRHGWWKHRILYDWSLHVPLIVRVPGEASGVSVRPLVRTIDVLPTLLEALNLPAPDMEGASLLTLMRGGKDDGRVAYADALNLLDAHAPRKMDEAYLDNLFCVADARWKLIWHETKPERVELYDMEQDPGETVNVAAENPDQVARLKRFLDERGAMDVRPPEDTSAAPNADALKGLGYTDGAE